ncbi:MAG: protein kinase [Vicinamibacteria bacterium]|nr:protein kinase [Vicinamibacteria bacterium]
MSESCGPRVDLDLEPGRQVGRYRLTRLLGRGGMGAVWQAEDERLGRTVALKLLQECCPGDATARARLLREARVASSLNHPGIAVIYEVDDLAEGNERTAYIAMEHVAGRTLDALVGDPGLDLDTALDLALQAADALAEAHAAGIVHRDVKPANVMVTAHGRVKVLDFGLALPVAAVDPDAPTRSRPAGAVPGLEAGAGTVHYMSPEQVRGGDLDPRTDVFSLGVVLYELLAGQRPFRGESLGELFDAILNRDPSPLELSDSRGADAWRVLRRMLAKDRRARHADMREVVADLHAVRAGQRLGSGPVALAPAAPAAAVLGFANVTGVREDDWLGTGIAETVSADLARLSGVEVIARERTLEVVRKLGDEADDDHVAHALGRELGARFVVSGACQRAGGAVRVTARVLDVERGAVVHTAKLDGPIADIFALQDRIVAEIAAGLRAVAAPAGIAAPGAGAGAAGATDEAEETRVVEAYEAYARGLINLRAETRDSLERALVYFERAVAADPGYARAHLSLAMALDLKSDYVGFPELRQRALVSFHRALELAPGLAVAWREMGATLITDGRLDEGLAAVEKARDLAPDDAASWGALARAHFIGLADFEGAASLYERALARNPQAGWYQLQLAHCCAYLRDFARGEAAARRAIALQEEFLSGREGAPIVGAYVRLGHLLALRGRDEEALLEYDRELGFVRRVDHALRERMAIELRVRRASSLFHLGRAGEGRDEAGAALAAFDRRLGQGADDAFTRYYAALAHALLAEREPALFDLARAVQGASRFNRARAALEADFAPFASEPRFEALLAG